MNPWHKRANEFIRDPAELLPLISPHPIHQFFAGDCSRLFDRLVVVIGAPGSGKTTLARLLEFPTLLAVRDFAKSSEVKSLVTSLSEATVLDDLYPSLLALRMPTAGQLRAIWELPYEERLRHRLLRSMIQAKAVLGWLRQLEDAGQKIQDIRINTLGVGEAARDSVRADDAEQFREQARATERAIYKLIGALVPPAESQLAEQIGDLAYEPFTTIESFDVGGIRPGHVLKLRPMLMLDDAHELHPSQLQDVDLWLRDREVRVAKWILTRADSLDLADFRRVMTSEEHLSAPGTQPGRDRIRFLLQDQANRDRSGFKGVAEDVAKRYLAPLSVFNRARDLKFLLNTATPAQVPEGTLKEIEREVSKLMKELGITEVARRSMEALFPPGLPEDVTAALTRVMLNREMKRTPQRSLFAASTSDAAEPEDQRKINRAVATGAELQLLQQYDRPFYFGFDRLADASNSNIEQFISLASVLVDHLETQIIRGKPPRIDARTQNKLLREHAKKLMDEWNFPYAPKVRKLVAFISDRSLDATMRVNAPLDDGANALGVLASDLASLNPSEELARIIHYALSYQALVLVEPYDCKGKTWALLELGGIPIIASGLTLSRGGFVESGTAQLRTAIEETT